MKYYILWNYEKLCLLEKERINLHLETDNSWNEGILKKSGLASESAYVIFH